MKRQNAAAGYVLSVQTVAGEATKEKIELLEDVTENQSEIIILTKAVKSLNRPCKLEIYTESPYVAAAFNQGWIKSWKTNGWKTAKDRDIANLEEWKALDEALKQHTYTFHVKKEHQYRSWLKTEVRRKGKEQGYV